LKSRGSIAIDPGAQLKKKIFPRTRAQLLNVRSSGAKLRIAILVKTKKGTISKATVHHLLHYPREN
jgi:hypothetical protein